MSDPKTLAVRTLVEFAATSGSLERGFSAAPSGVEGIEGHARVTAARGDDYQAEAPLQGEALGFALKGRADGIDHASHCVEEIKTLYGNPERIPDNQTQLHWAQLKVYGWLYSTEKQVEQVQLALIYFDLSAAREHRTQKTFARTELQSFVEALLTKFQHWQQTLARHSAKVQNWCAQARLPFPEMHRGQRTMAEAVYKAAVTGRVLLAEAPTGTGKTLAALFPVLKALAGGAVNKVFYLTCKGTAKHLPIHTLKQIARDAEPVLCAVDITAKDKACLNPGEICSGEHCRYADGFYDKLPAAREHALNKALLTQSEFAALAETYAICPYYLSLEMARWADVVVADVSYYFDSSGLLWQLQGQFAWRTALLIDEAHNLVSRARELYSAKLQRQDLFAAKKAVQANLKKPLVRLNREWLAINNAREGTVRSRLPGRFSELLAAFTEAYRKVLQQHPRHPMQWSPAQAFYFDCGRMQRLLSLADDDFCVEVDATEPRREHIHLRNLIPAALIAPRLDTGFGICLFSATVTPALYHRSLLGLPDSTVAMTLPSPFRPEQLQVRIETEISTRYRDREASIDAICARVVAQVRAQPGNALLFAASYSYLQMLHRALVSATDGLEIELILQQKVMTDRDRDAFIDRFRTGTNLLGCAVLGGAFAEGVDLPGKALTGVFVATLGMPQVNEGNEYLRRLLARRFGDGFAYTYIYPGLQKVVQAAGRVIRAADDRGYVWLLDDRFARPEISSLLPRWWRLEKTEPEPAPH